MSPEVEPEQHVEDDARIERCLLLLEHWTTTPDTHPEQTVHRLETQLHDLLTLTREDD